MTLEGRISSVDMLDHMTCADPTIYSQAHIISVALMINLIAYPLALVRDGKHYYHRHLQNLSDE
jgi:hypothetical protein